MNFLWQFKFFCLQWFIFDKYFCWIDLHSFFDWFLNIFLSFVSSISWRVINSRSYCFLSFNQPFILISWISSLFFSTLSKEKYRWDIIWRIFVFRLLAWTTKLENATETNKKTKLLLTIKVFFDLPLMKWLLHILELSIWLPV